MSSRCELLSLLASCALLFCAFARASAAEGWSDPAALGSGGASCMAEGGDTAAVAAAAAGGGLAGLQAVELLLRVGVPALLLLAPGAPTYV